MGLTDVEKNELVSSMLKAQSEKKKASLRKGSRAKAGKGDVEDVSGGETNVFLTRKRVPDHLENVGRNPEEIVLEEKRTFWDIFVGRKSSG